MHILVSSLCIAEGPGNVGASGADNGAEGPGCGIGGAWSGNTGVKRVGDFGGDIFSGRWRSSFMMISFTFESDKEEKTIHN